MGEGNGLAGLIRMPVQEIADGSSHTAVSRRENSLWLRRSDRRSCGWRR